MNEKDALQKIGFDRWVNQHGTIMYRNGDYEFWIYTNHVIHYVGWDMSPQMAIALGEVIKCLESDKK